MRSCSDFQNAVKGQIVAEKTVTFDAVGEMESDVTVSALWVVAEEIIIIKKDSHVLRQIGLNLIFLVAEYAASSTRG